MAFYYGDERLGETSAEAVEKLDYGECRDVAYDYLTRDFTVEELATFVLDAEDIEGTGYLARAALDNLRSWAESGQNFCYGGVECRDDSSSNRRPKASQCKRSGNGARKAPAKKTTKPKASGKKPAARSASGRR